MKTIITPFAVGTGLIVAGCSASETVIGHNDNVVSETISEHDGDRINSRHTRHWEFTDVPQVCDEFITYSHGALSLIGVTAPDVEVVVSCVPLSQANPEKVAEMRALLEGPEEPSQ